MNRFEITKLLQEQLKEIPRLIERNRMLQGIWDKKVEKMKKVKEIKQYKEKCATVLGKMLQLVRYLGVENITPKRDRINRFRVCYILYWLSIEIKELKKILCF